MFWLFSFLLKSTQCVLTIPISLSLKTGLMLLTIYINVGQDNKWCVISEKNNRLKEVFVC